MNETYYYTMLYKPEYLDSGVISYKPIRCIKGIYDEENKEFMDENTSNLYECVDVAVPSFGETNNHLIDALSEEIRMSEDERESEFLFAFPIQENKLLEYCKSMPEELEEWERLPLVVYERLIRGYLLYSFTENPDEENVFFVANKMDNHGVYQVDVSVDIADSLGAYEEAQGEESIIVSLAIPKRLISEDDISKSTASKKANVKTPAISSSSSKKVINDFNPDRLEQQVKADVIGQDHVVEPLVSMIYKNIKYAEQEGLKSNMLILGPSGCGKTELARSISRHLNIPIVIFDASTTSATGFIGNSAGQAIRDLIMVCDGDIERAEHGIIVIDEIDKLATGSGLDSINKGDVQNEFFKMLEGDEVTISAENSGERSFRFNPKNVTFIGIGAASEIIEQKRKRGIGFESTSISPVGENGEITIEPEDLIKLGLKPEILRRFNVIKVVRDLKQEDLATILSNSKISNLRLYQKAFKEVDHVKLVCTKPLKMAIAEQASKEKAGASGLKRIVDRTLQVAVRKIRLLKGDEGELVLSERTVKDPNDFKLYRRVDGKRSEQVYPPAEKVKTKVKK